MLGLFYFQVLQGGTLLIKLQSTSLDICHMIVKSLQSPPSASVLANLQVCAKLEVTSLSLFPDHYSATPPKNIIKKKIEIMYLGGKVIVNFQVSC